MLEDFPADAVKGLFSQHKGAIFGDESPDHPLFYFWRVESSYYFHKSGTVHASIHFEKWYILRRTPQAVWLVPQYARAPSSKWQLKLAEKSKKIAYVNTRRMWAYPTKKLAWKSFLIRQHRRLQHARNAFDAAHAVLSLTLEHDRTNPYA